MWYRLMMGGHCRSGSRILGTKTNSDTRIAVTITIAITITITIAIATSAAYHGSMSLCSSIHDGGHVSRHLSQQRPRSEYSILC